MISKFLFQKNNIFILFLLFFSIFINQHYGNRGVDPMDSFHFFDSGYRILNGEVPFIDYWLVKGVLMDYIQAIFFYIFGISWKSYVLHASLFNALLTISTFFVLKNFKLKTEFCFLYSLLFSILAYPSSGTPFIDHHSAFFSLLAIYSFLLAINNKKKLFWFLIPLCLFLGFLSKQVPAAYIIILISLVLIFYSFVQKKINYIKYFFSSSIFFLILILFFGKSQGITLSSFLEQYIFYPQSIGSERFNNLSFTYRGFIDHFKFIYLSIAPLFYFNIKKILTEKNYIKNNDFYVFVLLLALTISLIFHQLLTKNQTFIFFLIPILCAFSQISLDQNKLKFKKLITSFIILVCIFSTAKYHLRFNEHRKFHEMKNVNFNLTIDSKKIDKKFSGLNWISPGFAENPIDEINIINQIKSILKKDQRNKMVITNYSFLSAILDQKLHSPSRVYTGDGTTHPLKGNKYAIKYKELIDNVISKNNISVIYIMNTTNENINFHYVESYQYCSEEIFLLKELKSYELKNCNN